jgi:hypothetical protein
MNALSCFDNPTQKIKQHTYISAKAITKTGCRVVFNNKNGKKSKTTQTDGRYEFLSKNILSYPTVLCIIHWRTNVLTTEITI